MKDKDVIADFQFLGHRVSKLVLDTKLVEEKGPSNVSFDFDYEVMDLDLLEEDNRFLGIIQLRILHNSVFLEVSAVNTSLNIH